MRTLLLVLCMAVAMEAQDAKTVQAKADTEMAPVILNIQAFQNNWIMTHPNYWQGLLIPGATVPKDGVETPPDKTRKPSNDPAWASVAITVPATMPCAIAVIVHDGPKGKGYSIYLLADVGTTRYFKVLGFGNESERTANWAELKPIGATNTGK